MLILTAGGIIISTPNIILMLWLVAVDRQVEMSCVSGLSGARNDAILFTFLKVYAHRNFMQYLWRSFFHRLRLTVRLEAVLTFGELE